MILLDQIQKKNPYDSDKFNEKKNQFFLSYI